MHTTSDKFYAKVAITFMPANISYRCFNNISNCLKNTINTRFCGKINLFFFIIGIFRRVKHNQPY